MVIIDSVIETRYLKRIGASLTMDTLRQSFLMYPLLVFFLFFIGIPLSLIINAILAVVINLLVRKQKRYVKAVLAPSVIMPLIIVLSVFLYFAFEDIQHISPLRSLISDLKSVYFIEYYLMAMIIITIPQMLAHYLAKRRTEAARVYISVALGCVNTIALSIIIFIIGNLIGAQTN